MLVQPIRRWHEAKVSRALPEPGRTAVVLPFPAARRPANCFTMRDRMDLLEWTKSAPAYGICRVTIERPDPQEAGPEVGDFALFHDAVAEWASWAVAREAGQYLLWSPNSGETAGYFPTLADALGHISGSRAA